MTSDGRSWLKVLFYFVAVRLSALERAYPGGASGFIEEHGARSEGSMAVICDMGSVEYAVRELESYGLDEREMYAGLADPLLLLGPPETAAVTHWLELRYGPEGIFAARRRGAGALEEAPRGDRTVHHYRFVHELLPSFILFRRLLEPKEIRREPSAQAMLESLWARAADELPPEQRLGTEDLSARIVELDDGLPACLIRLPPPHQAPEAHLALVFFEGRLPRFFTAERADGRNGARSVRLGEWQGRDMGPSHVNHGELGSAEEAVFLDAVRRVRAGGS